MIVYFGGLILFITFVLEVAMGILFLLILLRFAKKAYWQPPIKAGRLIAQTVECGICKAKESIELEDIKIWFPGQSVLWRK